MGFNTYTIINIGLDLVIGSVVASFSFVFLSFFIQDVYPRLKSFSGMKRTKLPVSEPTIHDSVFNKQP